jgi:excinuclease UvrABC nuclease subunit
MTRNEFKKVLSDNIESIKKQIENFGYTFCSDEYEMLIFIELLDIKINIISLKDKHYNFLQISGHNEIFTSVNSMSACRLLTASKLRS